ncbi:MAG: cysteine--tRNA ligase [Acidobacteriota bacterium]
MKIYNSTMLRFFNTITRREEEFQPLENNLVRIYVCGPTVHDYAHIGNFRTFLFADLLRRYLKYKGYQVKQVMNITDIEDKTIKKSIESGMSLSEYTRKYTDYFLEDLFKHLQAERPEQIVFATDHIDDMVSLIRRLEANGHTYMSEGSVYYRIASFPDYGRLSGAKLSGNMAGARVDVDEYEKEDARDFVLWKGARDGEPSWSTPFGDGRPGWHLECSAMSMRYLGETFDIHAGGTDLIFPHHENEIAQSEGATGKPFVRYWLHAEHLMIDGKKMSKSEGNYYTLRDLMALGHSLLGIRYLLVSVPYRKQLNFTIDGLRGSEVRVKKLQDFRQRLFEANCPPGANPVIAENIVAARQDFESAMDDNLNTSAALAALANFETGLNTAMNGSILLADNRTAALALIDDFQQVLGIFGELKHEILDSEIQQLIEARKQARMAKNFARADEIRQQLAAQGIILEDTKDGTRWHRA